MVFVILRPSRGHFSIDLILLQKQGFVYNSLQPQQRFEVSDKKSCAYHRSISIVFPILVLVEFNNFLLHIIFGQSPDIGVQYMTSVLASLEAYRQVRGSILRSFRPAASGYCLIKGNFARKFLQKQNSLIPGEIAIRIRQFHLA